ncbi:PstS family phosphate ABC transporter substrate-binding protein [Olivibacter sitiensis]|uniref:PstS family phosphate ABC transporter substrate-binding protein n=1 Tax=Olivibacter sitiensis TaxID=376470 RepID=UPI000415352F|nr:PstS family phosphate ABC transporter substrate-binding protein [Olivibacter sitiensis]
MRQSSYFILFLSLLCTLACGGGHDSKRGGGHETISVSGAFALYPMMIQWSQDFKEKHPNVRFNISAGGAGKGIADALSGMVDIAMVSRDIHPEEYEQGAYLVNVANDAVVATMNANNPLAAKMRDRGLTKQEFIDIFLNGRVHRWDQLKGIEGNYDMHVYVRSDAAGAAETWAKYLGASQEDLLGIGVFGDPGQAQAIMRDPLSIGFSNLNYVYSLKTRKPQPEVQIIPIDQNGNGRVDDDEYFYQNLDSLNQAIGDGRYPSPPARTLGLLFKGKPSNKVLTEFLRYILSSDGQARLPENGYVSLNEEAVKQELTKIK